MDNVSNGTQADDEITFLSAGHSITMMRRIVKKRNARQ